MEQCKTCLLYTSPGAATGKVVFSAERAVKLHKAGEKDLLLVRLETSPEDIEGMVTSNGILTVRGGMTSHAAVVARGMGTCLSLIHISLCLLENRNLKGVKNIYLPQFKEFVERVEAV